MQLEYFQYNRIDTPQSSPTLSNLIWHNELQPNKIQVNMTQPDPAYHRIQSGITWTWSADSNIQNNLTQSHNIQSNLIQPNPAQNNPMRFKTMKFRPTNPNSIGHNPIQFKSILTNRTVSNPAQQYSI